MHYIMKCSPDVRGAIRKSGDVVYLKWARYTVYDRYYVLTCYHCQRYGHAKKKTVALKRMVILQTVVNVLETTVQGHVPLMKTNV